MKKLILMLIAVVISFLSVFAQEASGTDIVAVQSLLDQLLTFISGGGNYWTSVSFWITVIGLLSILISYLQRLIPTDGEVETIWEKILNFVDKGLKGILWLLKKIVIFVPNRKKK